MQAYRRKFTISIARCWEIWYNAGRKKVKAVVDCHIHMVLDGEDWKKALERHTQGVDVPWVHKVLQSYRDAGFTYLRDGGDRWVVGKKARQLAPQYGITYRTPLGNLCRAGHYGGFIGETYENFREYAALVRQHRQDGADFIKIMISGLMDFDHYGVLTHSGFAAEDIRELTHIAHEEGFSVMAHANGADTVLAAAEAGVDSVEHGAYLNNEALCAMRENGTVWVPTLSTIGNLRKKGRFSQRDVEMILHSAMENVEAFAQMGGLVAPGTDAGAWQVPHSIDSEYTLLKKALGASAQAVLDRGIAAIQAKF